MDTTMTLLEKYGKKYHRSIIEVSSYYDCTTKRLWLYDYKTTIVQL